MADISYYSRRAAQEADAAERSASPEARRIHQEMAARYATLANRRSLLLAA